ncbi:MAG: L-threonylcarbamoyladenylate synthase [Deltaproteobacteria bacterium]|nr:L-threonylcarbamoyladenylate synthase [Deltaproteobacteria bacterium]
MLIEINPLHPEPRKIARAVQLLQSGGIVAYPTDTVYALGVDLGSKSAIDKLYGVKRLARDQPLAFVVPDLADLAKYAVVQDHHYRFIKHLVPGPYTFILPATREVPRLVMMKRKTIGIRVPDHAVTRALAQELGRPIMTTTATHPVDGSVLFDPSEISDLYGGVDLVLDAGVGETVSSTILDMTDGEPTLRREGAGMERIEKLYGVRRALGVDDL